MMREGPGRMDTLFIAKRIQEAEPFRAPQAIEAAKTGILDYIASVLLADGEPETGLVAKLYGIRNSGGIASACDEQTEESARAVFNGFKAHLLDIDDAHSDVRGHPGAVVLSALFAAAGPDTPGKDFLEAYIIGTEVMARLGESVNQEHYLRGWHNTSTLGSMAAAAAVSRLLHLSPEDTAAALGTAATQACGLRAEFGTSVKAMHIGFAARNGLEAVRLTQAGIRGDRNVLFKRFGFYDVLGYKHSGDERETVYAAAWNKEWGKSWRISSPGLWLKRYPFCSAAMAGCDAAAALRGRHPYRPEEIEYVEIGFFPGKDSALYARNPETGEQGRFSIEYIVWLGLTGIPWDLAHFSATPLSEEIKTALNCIHRITLEPKDCPPYTQVTVRCRNGKWDQERVVYPKGAPQNPLSLEDEVSKLALSVADTEKRETVLKAVKELESGPVCRLLESISK